MGMGKKTKSGEPVHEMSFLDHLEELRWHLIRAFIGIIIMAGLIFLNINFVFDHIILAPKNPGFITNSLLCNLASKTGIESLCINSQSFNIININMSGQFTIHIWTSLIGGIILSFPYVIWEIWKFIAPALEIVERKKTNGILFYINLLFLIGILFGYFILAPLSLHFLGSYSISSEVVNQISLSSYNSTLTSITIATGAIFEMPIFVYFLAKMGIVSSAFLKKYRKHSIIVNLIIAAIITPPDVFSQTLVSLPLFGLYELGIFIAKRVEKKKLKMVDTI
jgi:sec-independent protein translocase protein TatC